MNENKQTHKLGVKTVTSPLESLQALLNSLYPGSPQQLQASSPISGEAPPTVLEAAQNEREMIANEPGVIRVPSKADPATDAVQGRLIQRVNTALATSYGWAPRINDDRFRRAARVARALLDNPETQSSVKALPLVTFMELALAVPRFDERADDSERRTLLEAILSIWIYCAIACSPIIGEGRERMTIDLPYKKYDILTEEEFTLEVARAWQKAVPSARAEAVRELDARLVHPGGATTGMYLHSAYIAYERTPSEKDTIIAGLARSIVSVARSHPGGLCDLNRGRT